MQYGNVRLFNWAGQRNTLSVEGWRRRHSCDLQVVQTHWIYRCNYRPCIISV